MSQLGEFLATIQNKQDARTAELEARLAELEGKEENKEGCGCGSYDELLTSYGERISDLESSVGSGGSGGEVLPASIGYNKTGFIRNSGYSYNRTVEVWVNNPTIGATYTLAGTAEAVEPITYDGTAEVCWDVQTPGDTGTVTLSQTIGDTSTEIGSVDLTAVDSDPLLHDTFGLIGSKTPINVCSGGGIFLFFESINPYNQVVRAEWRASSEELFNNVTMDEVPFPNHSSNGFYDDTFMLQSNPLESGTITVVGYDAYGNRTPEMTHEIQVNKLTILVHRVEDGDNHKFYFANLSCNNSIAITVETKQSDDEEWSAYELSEEDKQKKCVTLPKSIFDSTLVRATVTDEVVGCFTDPAIPLTSDMTSIVIR